MPIGMNKGAAKQRPKGKSEAEKPESVETVDDLSGEDSGESSAKPSMDKKTIGILATVVAVVVIGIAAFLHGGSDEPDEPEVSNTEQVSSATDDQPPSNGVYKEDGTTIDPNGVNPGLSSFEDNENYTTDATVYSPDDMIKDLNGLDVSAVYNVDSFDYVDDYVSYETRRAIIDDGMELYWLEADYNGLKYRIQVPFYYYRALGKSGIHRARIEVLTLVGGGKIISYMQLVDEEK